MLWNDYFKPEDKLGIDWGEGTSKTMPIEWTEIKNEAIPVPKIEEDEIISIEQKEKEIEEVVFYMQYRGGDYYGGEFYVDNTFLMRDITNETLEDLLEDWIEEGWEEEFGEYGERIYHNMTGSYASSNPIVFGAVEDSNIIGAYLFGSGSGKLINNTTGEELGRIATVKTKAEREQEEKDKIEQGGEPTKPKDKPKKEPSKREEKPSSNVKQGQSVSLRGSFGDCLLIVVYN